MSESALRHPNYAIYLAGNTLSLHGLWVYRVALGWFAWQLSYSELWVGIIAFTQFAPAVVFGPIFGVLADRFDRKATSILVNSCSVINMLLLGLLTALEFIDIRVLALLSLMQGILDGAHVPVRLSIVPNLVPKRQLDSAIALTSVAFNLSRFVGPAIAGPVIAIWGVGTAFVVNGVSYLALIGAMIVVRLNPSEGAKRERKHAWTELKEGAHYVFTHPVVSSLLVAVAAGSVFARGGLEMLPAFADAVYSRGAGGLAILTSAIGGGAVITGVTLSMTVTRGSNHVDSTFTLHPLSAAWVEGVEGCGVRGGGQGEPSTGGVTWNTMPGFGAASGSTLINNATPVWNSTAAMVSDVQGWLDDPGTNFGYILIGDEANPTTTRRFDSSEGAAPPDECLPCVQSCLEEARARTQPGRPDPPGPGIPMCAE